MTITNLFFVFALSISLLFVITFIVLLSSIQLSMNVFPIISRRWNMVSQFLMIFTLVSIWISLIWGVVILVSGVHFWLKHSDFKVDKKALPYYPKVTIVVPAHNEDVVIAQTAKAILNLNYPHDKVELLLFADNCFR